jgi:hypothetical protein
MIESHVREVRLRLRTDVADAAELRPTAERLVQATLERCAALLEERSPGRIVLIRRLPLHWQIDEAMLDDDTQVDELARSAADAIERRALASPLEHPAADNDVVLFDDEAHLRASHLLALARGRTAWFFDVLAADGADDPLAALAMPSRRATAHAALVNLARGGVLVEVLTAQPKAAVAVLAAALGIDAAAVARARRQDRGMDVAPAAVDGVADIELVVTELAAVASHWPTLAAPARALVLRAHAALLLGTDLDAPAAITVAAAVPVRSLDVAVDSTGRTTGSDALARVDAPAIADHSHVLAASGVGEDATDASTTPIATHCAGLFYLLDRVQELDLAESLWKACLPEGQVLATAASALLGRSFLDDPAPALFGGVEAPLACPEVTSEQHAEIATATCISLAAALVRRGLAEIPAAVVTLAEHPGGRLLVASAEGSPFVFFAWPAATPQMVQAGLRALLDGWPHRGVLSASPALATLDASGRLRPRRGAAPAPFLPAASSAAAASLLAVVVGAPCQLFAARAGLPAGEGPEAFVARFLVRPGRVLLSAERMDVMLADDEVDIDVRRAGLDRDPGWLPWLRRTVRFVFEKSTPGAMPQRQA